MSAAAHGVTSIYAGTPASCRSHTVVEGSGDRNLILCQRLPARADGTSVTVSQSGRVVFGLSRTFITVNTAHFRSFTFLENFMMHRLVAGVVPSLCDHAACCCEQPEQAEWVMDASSSCVIAVRSCQRINGRYRQHVDVARKNEV